MTVGPTVAEAFTAICGFERSCQGQAVAMACKWPGLLRKLDRLDRPIATERRLCDDRLFRPFGAQRAGKRLFQCPGARDFARADPSAVAQWPLCHDQIRRRGDLPVLGA